MTLSSLIKNYLQHLEFERNAAQLTIRNYGYYLRCFLEFCGDIDPKNIDINLIQKYKLYLSQKNLKKVTRNYFMIALRALLRYLTEKNIKTLLADGITLEKSGKKDLQVLDESQLKSLLEAPDTLSKDGIRDRAVLETLFSTGMLVSELTHLNCDTVDLISRKFEINGKGGKKRKVFLSESACVWLKKYLEVRKDTFKPLFIRFQGKVSLENFGEKMRLTARSIERIVEKYVKKLGLGIKATPQTLRHLYTKDLILSGSDIKSVSEKLGHTNVVTTQNYRYLFDA